MRKHFTEVVIFPGYHLMKAVKTEPLKEIYGRFTFQKQTNQLFRFSNTPGGGDSDMKWTGMLVVSLRGVNFGFWSRLGCSGQNVIIFSHQGLV